MWLNFWSDCRLSWLESCSSALLLRTNAGVVIDMNNNRFPSDSAMTTSICSLPVIRRCRLPRWSRDSSIGIVADYGLDAWGPEVRVPLGSWIFSSLRSVLGPIQSPIKCLTGILSPGLRGWGIKLTTHLQLVPRTGTYWPTHQLPQCLVT
jgi:hypothetical protein